MSLSSHWMLLQASFTMVWQLDKIMFICTNEEYPFEVEIANWMMTQQNLGLVQFNCLRDVISLTFKALNLC